VLITACDPDSPAAQLLLGELSATLAAITGSSGSASFDAEDARLPRSLFVVAHGDNGAPLGCGALRPLADDVAELKRMYARPGGAGTGAALLAHLEQAVAAMGYRAIWLETRRVNTRAVAFYTRLGYAPIANYGKYAGRTEAVCLAKTLTGPQPE
jgi:GNAT superfamily N-acetyltransferase